MALLHALYNPLLLYRKEHTTSTLNHFHNEIEAMLIQSFQRT